MRHPAEESWEMLFFFLSLSNFHLSPVGLHSLCLTSEMEPVWKQALGTHTHTHTTTVCFSCYDGLWGLKAAMGQSVQLPAKGDKWNFVIIYLIIKRSRMKIFSGTEFLRCKQTSKYDLVCSCRIFFLHSFSYSCSSQFKNTLVSMPESALPAPALHLLSPVAIN